MAGSDLREAKAEPNIARLSLLLLPWQTCSPRIDEPEWRVTGGESGVGGQLGAGLEGLAQGLGQEDCCGPDPDSGR